jgi:predicted permease
MESLWQDFRFALRQLIVEKGFSIPAILTFTLGIGATATLLNVVNAVLVKELPYQEPSRLVMLQGSLEEKGEVQTWPIALLDFADWRQRSKSFSEMSVWATWAFNLEQGEQSQRLWGEFVNDSYLSMLGLEPQVGRFFTPDEDARPMEQYVVVLGDGLWRNTFGADPGVVGRDVRLNGKTYRVVGVAPKGFRGLSDQADLWVPSMLPPVESFVTTRNMRFASGAGRLKPGVTREQAQEEMKRITAELAEEFPESNQGLSATVTALEEFWFGSLRNGLLLLTVGAAILLIIACINVASLLMTRAVLRQRTWSIRMALGAGRGRLIRQALTESTLLCLIGGVAGLLLGQWASRALLAISGIELPSFVELSTGPEVVLPVLCLVVLCSVLFGLAPVWAGSRADLARNLGREEKLPPRSRGLQIFQKSIVVVQVALALTLTVHAALLAKGFGKMVSEDFGFRSDNLLTVRMDMRAPQYLDAELVTRLVRETYLPRVSAVPGVEKLALCVPAMPTDGWEGAEMTVEDHDSDGPDGTYLAMVHAVTPEYFDVLGIPIERGRGFTLQDIKTDAVIISRAMAELHWPGQDPIGKRIKIGVRSRTDIPWLQVVGMVSNVAHQAFREDKAPAPDIYVSLLQIVRRPLTVNFLARPRQGVSMAELQSALLKEIKAINPELPPYDVATMEERLARQVGRARFLVILIGIFAGLALILAAVGIYGVISYSVSQREREIAIRVSLGATRASILRMIVTQGAVLAATGLILGLAAVYALSRFLVSLLYQTSATDPLVLLGTSLGLFLVILAANYLPARRAATLDPVAGLRFE